MCRLKREDCVIWPFFIFKAVVMLGKKIVFNSQVPAKIEGWYFSIVFSASEHALSF